MNEKSEFRVERMGGIGGSFMFKEGQTLLKQDISLITLHTNLLIQNAKKEYIRGYNDGYYEGKGVTDKVVCKGVKD